MRTLFQNCFHKYAELAKTFLRKLTNVQMCKCANVQMCKCAKNRRAQNAQICISKYFPNATFANSIFLHMLKTFAS